jgi:hypothetical protein
MIVGSVFVMLGLASLVSVTLPKWTLDVTAESHLEAHPPQLAVDGRPLTFWAPESSASGVMNVYLPKRQFVRRVGLLNARNREQREHTARGYVIQLFSGSVLMTQVSGKFDARMDEPPWVWRTVDSRRIDKIVVRITGTRKQSPGLAEFRVE